MDLGPDTQAALLERALGGEPVDDEQVRALVAVATAVRSVDQSRLEPDTEFVAALRGRLLDEETPIAVGGRGADDGRRPTVLRLPQRPLQLAAAVAAAFVLAAALLGLVSRSAVPGDFLYPVKQLLDRAAVGLSGSRLDEGRTHLAQAQQHISEARDLLDRGPVDPTELDMAFDAATASVTAADSVLTEVHVQEGRPEALTELTDFLTRARLQVEAMDSRIPEASRASYERLRAVLGGSEVEALRRLAACTVCGDAAVRAQAALATLAPGASPTPTSVPAATTAPGLPLPTATLAPPSIALTTDGAALDGGGVTLPGATVDLPSAGVTTTGVVIGGGGVTLPGATVPLPTVSVPLPTIEPTSLLSATTLLPTLP